MAGEESSEVANLRSRTDRGGQAGGRAAARVLEMENFLTMVSALTSWVSQPPLQSRVFLNASLMTAGGLLPTYR